MKYFFLVGEASGDLHASNLMHALREQDPQAAFYGLGGDKMAQNGCFLFQHYRKMAYMGVIAVVKNLRHVKENFHIAEQALLETQPDVLVLVDYPSFNLRMAAFARKHLPSIRIVYYIPPKIWAWKTHRVHKIARLCDEVLGIFPFEPEFYARYGYRCTYVGNPTVDALRPFSGLPRPSAQRPSGALRRPTASSEASYTPFGGLGAPIALLPGSRRSEIEHCLPIMLRAAHAFPEYPIAVAAAPGIPDAFYTRFLQHGEVLTRNTYDLVLSARAAIVNSGTATLETALLGCPQEAVYYIACSKVLGWLRPILFKIPYFTLVNIIPNREIIQEQVSYHFPLKHIQCELDRLLHDEGYRQNMLANYASLRTILGTQPAATTAAKIICKMG